MASGTIGLDDIMVSLMTMGFEYNDCQDAITNGKLTVQAAVEWILAGKPGNVAASAQPKLKLNQAPQQTSSLQGDTSNPFVESNLSSLQGNFDMPASTSSQSSDIDMTENTVVSRSHLSDKQHQIKQDFEEKERAAARKKVQEEKRKQKLDKERVLKEIQADREKQKLTKQHKSDSSVPPAVPNEPQPSSSTPPKPEDESDTALIQVRLPSGEMFRQTFPATATLNNVWDAVRDRIKGAMNSHQGFIQPWPRREFSKEEMGQSLRHLGLTPSGSLVLKKKEAKQASTPMQSDPGGEDVNMEGVEYNPAEAGGDEDDEDDVPMQERGHDWGRGFRVDDGNGHPVVNMDFANAAQAMRRNPFGPDNERPVGEEEAGGPVFEGFGMRLVPQGVPADDGHHLQRRAADLAAAAAAQRFAQAQPVQQEDPARTHSEIRYNAHSLHDLCMVALARRITDPRTPVFSMTGLSNELLQSFVSYMKKERLLNPKVVHILPSYLLQLNLDFYPYTTNELLYSARILVNLHHLSMNSCTLITDAGLSALKGMKVLKFLSLQNCGQITDCCFPELSELQSLQTLNLEGTKVTDAGVSRFANSGACLHLSHLNLGRTSITQHIIPTLAKFQHLKSLCVKQNKLAGLSGIESISNLESLDVSNTDIVSDSILCMTGLPHIRHLCLTGTQELVGDTALLYLKDLSLTSLTLPSRVSTTDMGMPYITGFKLSALDLTNYTNVGDVGMLSVGQISSLKTLLLTNTRVTDEGMTHLTGLTNLEVLFVDKTAISDTGVSVIQNFKMLAELSLASTSVTSDLLKQRILNGCFMLSKLNLSRTAIGDKGLQCLKLPNLTLLNLDATRAHEYIDMTVKTNCPSIKHITLANLSTVPEDYEG